MVEQSPNKTVADIGQRYRVEELLGRGGMGAVYRVFDQSTRRTIALKRLERDVDAADARLRFRHEFHTLARLRHPSIVDVIQFGSDGASLYYTMDLVLGRDLHELAPLSVEDVCRLGRDVASALALLHARKLIHRDVTPRNVRYMQTGKAVLIDFGLVSTPGIMLDIAGTPSCMAPESVRGMSLDYRADLYGLGAIMYFALTGHHAYPAKKIEDLGDAWRISPLPPSRHDPDIPKSLDDLVMGLLRKDPQGRPSTAGEVIARLEAIGHLPSRDDGATASGYLHSSELVGREHEMSVLREFIADTVAGKQQSVVIEAVSGMGKTRLLRELALEAQLAGLIVVEAQGGAMLGPYGLLRALTRSLLSAAPLVTRDVATPFLPVIARVIPELRGRSDSDQAQPLPSDPGEDRMRLQTDLVGFLDAVVRRVGLLIVVDDFQRSDEASAAVLATFAQATIDDGSAFPALTAFGVRTDEGASAPDALDAIREGARVLRLTGLDVRDTEALVASLFGAVPHVSTVAAWMHSATGSPLHCISLARELVDCEKIKFLGDTWILPEDLSSADRAASLGASMDLRISALTPSARALGQVLAVHGGNIPLAIARVLAEVSDDDIFFRATDELMFEEVIIASGTTYRFRHDGLREALLRSIKDQHLRAHHLRVGQLLADRADPDSSERNAEIGFHLLRGGEEVRGASLLAQAARELCKSQSFADAIPLLEAALDVFVRTKAPQREIHELRYILVVAACQASRETLLKHAGNCIQELSYWSGLVFADRLRPVLGSHLAFVLSFLWASILWLSTPRSRRGIGPITASTQCVALSAYVATVHSLSFDQAGMRKLVDRLWPFGMIRGILPYAAYLLALNFKDIALGRYGAVRKNASLALAIFERDSLLPLSDLDRKMGRATSLYMLLSMSAHEQDPRFDEEAKLLMGVALRFFDASIGMARAFQHRLRGEESIAIALERDAERLFLRLGSMWIVKSQMQWMNSFAYGHTRDIVGLKRSIDGLARWEKLGFFFGPHLALAEGEYARERGDLADAEQILWKLLNELPCEEAFVRLAALAALAETYLLMGMHERAAHFARQGVELATADDVDRLASEIRCAQVFWLASARRGEAAAAASERALDALIVRVEELASPLLCGSVHEARARLAKLVGDDVQFEIRRIDADRWYRLSGNPVLVARAESLSEIAHPRFELGTVPLSDSSAETVVAAKSASTSQTGVPDGVADDNHAES